MRNRFENKYEHYTPTVLMVWFDIVYKMMKNLRCFTFLLLFYSRVWESQAVDGDETDSHGRSKRIRMPTRVIQENQEQERNKKNGATKLRQLNRAR